jgi:hypothetical protein
VVDDKNTVVENTVVPNMENLEFKNGVIQPETTTHPFGKMSNVTYE